MNDLMEERGRVGRERRTIVSVCPTDMRTATSWRFVGREQHCAGQIAHAFGRRVGNPKNKRLA